MAAGPLSSCSRRRRSSDIRSTDLRWPPSQNAAAHMRARVPKFLSGRVLSSHSRHPWYSSAISSGLRSVPSKMSRARRRASSALGADFQMFSNAGLSTIAVRNSPAPDARSSRAASAWAFGDRSRTTALPALPTQRLTPVSSVAVTTRQMPFSLAQSRSFIPKSVGAGSIAGSDMSRRQRALGEIGRTLTAGRFQVGANS